MKFPGKNTWAILFIFLGGLLFAQTEFKIPDKPSVIYPVNDYAQVLSPEQTSQLNNKLISYRDSTSTEIIICTIQTLDGDDINYVGARWGEKWGIGQKEKNNGILLLIAVNDHKLAIQTGRGTEDAMTDLMSGVIINQYMVPYLRQNDFYGAINSGTDQIINVLQGKFKADPKSNLNNDDAFSGFAVAVIIFIFILVFALMSRKGKKNTYYDRNGKKKNRDDDFWGGLGGGIGGGFLGGGFGGFGGGSSGGGGFGGFGGGGSFGGGGASGSW